MSKKPPYHFHWQLPEVILHKVRYPTCHRDAGLDTSDRLTTSCVALQPIHWARSDLGRVAAPACSSLQEIDDLFSNRDQLIRFGI